jgi:purine-nucleoside phosphorylase
MDITYFNKAAEFLPDECFKLPPDLSIILGSGWGDSLKKDKVLCRIPYSEIPGMGATTVTGHTGEFILYEYAGKRIAAFSGRRHWYEGIGWECVVLPVELVRRMGGKSILLTNASGGINPALKPGDFVIIKDHINTIAINPLIGPHVSEWGTRFPDMTEIYDKQYRILMSEVASSLNLRIMEGVYAFTSGPVYETPAEIHAYAHMGADIVGMSTVPEAVFAKACGIHVAGLSLVSNYAAGISSSTLTHDEVITTSNAAKPIMAALLDKFITSF